MVNAATAAAGGANDREIGIGEGVEGIAKQAELDAMHRAQMNDESQSNKRKFCPSEQQCRLSSPGKGASSGRMDLVLVWVPGGMSTRLISTMLRTLSQLRFKQKVSLLLSLGMSH